MRDEQIRNFYKAAGRAGMNQYLPEDIKTDIEREITHEDTLAPFPPTAVMTPRTSGRTRETGAPRDMVQPQGGNDQTPLTTSRRVLDEADASKYFTPRQIEQLKYQRLQEIAENDRKKVLNVLYPVISLLGDIKLNGGDDNDAVQEVKDRLCAIAQGQAPVLKSEQNTFSFPSQQSSERRIRFAEAIKPIQYESSQSSAEYMSSIPPNSMASKWINFFTATGCCGMTAKSRRTHPAPVDLNYIPNNHYQVPEAPQWNSEGLGQPRKLQAPQRYLSASPYLKSSLTNPQQSSVVQRIQI